MTVRDIKKTLGLRENEDEQIIKNIKKCSITGRPCGDASFINKLKKLFGRRFGALELCRGDVHAKPKKP